MYAIVTSHLSPTNVCYYTSLSGQYGQQMTRMGVEPNSSLLRGYLHGTLQSLKWLESLFGVSKKNRVDILIENRAIAKQLEETTSIGSMHGDNDSLWNQLFAYKEKFDLRFVTSPEESGHIKTIYAWSSTPPIPADLPAEYTI
jgi:hypothetical protein